MAPFKSYTYSSNKDPLHVTYSELPGSVRPDEVVVKVHSTSLNPVDAIVYNSAYWPLSYLNDKQGTGRDYSGVVEKIGADVSAKLGINVGDRVVGFYWHVFGTGALAEYVVAKPLTQDFAFSKVPSNLSLAQAASYPLVLLTAFSMMNGHTLKDSKILVLGGATSVGRYLVQLAKVLGASEIVTTNGARSNELVQSLGSTQQIDYHQHPNLKVPVLESAKQRVFNYVYDCAGNDDLFDVLTTVLDPQQNGYVTIVGERHYDYANDHGLSLAVSAIKTKVREVKSLLGLNGYAYRFDMVTPNKEWFDAGFRLFEEGKLVPYIDSTYTFEQAPDAFKKLSEGTASGKIVITVNPTVE
ncbi:hypothetical protein DICA3_F11188 [Diutina catenulata]